MSGPSSWRSSAPPLIAAFGWRGASIVFGVPAILIAIAILLLVRETGADRAAAVASGSVRDAFRRIVRDRDIRGSISRRSSAAAAADSAS